MDLSFFSNLFNTTDPASAARLRGGLVGAAQAISQPYGNLGSALVGGAQGSQQARQDYSQQQFQDLRLKQLQSQLTTDQAKRDALNNLFKQGAQGSIMSAPQAGLAPAAPIQATPLPQGISQSDEGFPQQDAAPIPQAPMASAQAPQFHLPAGFDSPEQFQAYAQINPDDALKRMFPEQQKFDGAPHEGINPTTGKLEEFTVNPQTGKPNWLGVSAQPKAPNTVGGLMWDAASNSFKPIPGYTEQASRIAAAGRAPAEPSITAPMTVEAADPKNPGQRTQFLAQQDKRTGQWYTGDQTRVPLTDVMLPGGVPGGGRAAAQVGRMMGAAKDVSTGLQNVSELPITASTGMMGLLGGKQEAHGLMDATKTVLANQMTPQDVQSTKAMYVGIAKAIGTLDAGGLQTSDTFLKQIGGLLPAEGDTHMTKLLKLAELRQQADNALESQLNGPLLSSQQKVYAKKLRDDLKKSIPFTPLDVLHLDKSNNPNAKISDYVKGVGLGGGNSPPADAIRELKMRGPKADAQFDAIFGPGAAAKYRAQK